MASHPSIEFHTLTLPDADTTLPSALNDHLTKLKSDTSIHSIYLGQQLEKPTRWSLIITRRPSSSSSSGPSAAWTTALDALVESRSSVTAPSPHGDLHAALDAPCTEVFTGYGVDHDFLDANMKPFADGMVHDHPPGFHGLAYAEFEQPAGGDQPAGAAVRALLGWDSKEAHLAQKGEGKGAKHPPNYLSILNM